MSCDCLYTCSGSDRTSHTVITSPRILMVRMCPQADVIDSTHRLPIFTHHFRATNCQHRAIAHEHCGRNVTATALSFSAACAAASQASHCHFPSKLKISGTAHSLKQALTGKELARAHVRSSTTCCEVLKTTLGEPSDLGDSICGPDGDKQ